MRKIGILAVAILVSLGLVPAANASDIEGYSPEISETEISALYDRMADAIARGEQGEIVALEEEMKQAGIEFLSSREVEQRFPDESRQSAISPRVALPGNTNVQWSTYRSTFSLGGVSYNIQTLTAQPISGRNSILLSNGSQTVLTRPNYKAGAVNVLKSVASAAVSAIPGSSLYVSAYDAVNGFVSGIKTSTIVTEAHVVYTWSKAETAQFKYVKKSSQSDDYQVMSYVSTQAKVVVGLQFSSFGAVGLVANPDVIQQKYTRYLVPVYYGNNTRAVESFLGKNVSSIAWVPDYTLELAGGRKFTVKMSRPNFPAHLYY